MWTSRFQTVAVVRWLRFASGRFQKSAFSISYNCVAGNIFFSHNCTAVKIFRSPILCCSSNADSLDCETARQENPVVSNFLVFAFFMWLLGVFWKQPSKQWPQLCTLTLKGGLSTTYEHSVWLDPAWSYARQSDQSRSKPKFLHTQVSRGLCLSHLVPRTSEHCVWLDRWSYPMPDKAAQNQPCQICWTTHGRERSVSLCSIILYRVSQKKVSFKIHL